MRAVYVCRLTRVVALICTFLTEISVCFHCFKFMFQSLVIPEKFQHILRVMGTNIDGNRKVMFAMTAIKGVGRRYANIVLKKADIDLDKRAGECSEEEVKIDLSLISYNQNLPYLLLHFF